MKRLFRICVMMVGVALTATSCLWSNDDDYKSTALVSVVDGDASLGQYVVFESGQKALITKGENLIGNIPASAYYPDKATGEARAVIYYTAEAVNDAIFDGQVKIEALKPVDIQLTKMSLPEGVAEVYNDDIMMNASGITYSRNKYVNLQFFYPSSGSTYDSQHKFELVYNPSKEGFFASSYPANDDGYLYLELYHDSGNDAGKISYSENIISFYLDDLMIGRHIPTEYMGIKILYMENGNTRKLEYKFAK